MKKNKYQELTSLECFVYRNHTITFNFPNKTSQLRIKNFILIFHCCILSICSIKKHAVKKSFSYIIGESQNIVFDFSVLEQNANDVGRRYAQHFA